MTLGPPMHESIPQEAATLNAHKLRGLGLLAGAIAHDFNNLLLAMDGYAELAILKQRDGQDATEHLETLRKVIDRSQSLAQQLLDYVNHKERTRLPLDLSQLALDMARLIRVAIPKHIQFHFDLDQQAPFMRGDAAQLQQVVLNLITNAAGAIGASEGQIVLRTGFELFDPDLSVGTCFGRELSRGHYLVLEVRDSGCGIAADTLVRLFDHGFTTKPDGHGLGLGIMRSIVMDHDGAWVVESTPGIGSRFRILFPPCAP